MIRLGSQGWNYTAWVGPFYPAGTRPAPGFTFALKLPQASP